MLRLSQGIDRGVERDFELTAALRALQAAYKRIGSLQVTLALQQAAIEVLTQVETREILQIVREALGYALRKTLATRATVSMRKRGARICLRICDNGNGFKLVDGQRRHEGLALIEARARKIGGTVHARVEAGKGAQLLVEFSLEPILVSV
jgi:nitrate/nitrite-specific signal transduction histidine kinase